MKLRVKVETGSLAGQEFVLEAGSLSLGREAGCGIRFGEEVGVSRHHAELRAEGSRFVVSDQNSTNGTLVNGQSVESAVLCTEDLIQLGADGPRLRVVLEGRRPPLAAAPDAAPPATAAMAAPTATPGAPAGRVQTLAGLPRPSLLDSGLYDPERDKGRRYSASSLVVVFGMMGIGLFLGLLTALLSFFSLGFGAAAVGVVVAFAPAPVYLAVWLWLDRNDPEPAWVLAGALAWGAGAATFVSAIVNDLFTGSVAAVTRNPGLAQFLSASISAPFIEEGTKGMAVLLIFLFLRREFDGVIDGVVYAGVVALGFATVENVLYYGRAVAQGGVGGLIVVFVLRGILGPFGHAVYTSMTGIGCGLARQSHNAAVRLIAPIAGYAGAVFLHFLWNTLAGIAGAAFLLIYVVFWAPLFLAFFAALVYMGYRESRLIRRMLDFEVARGLLRRDQADLVSSWTRRLGFLLSSVGDPARLRARRQFLYAATRLALCYWHVERAQAAGGLTLSVGQIPEFQRDVARLRDAI
jgi:RsiW-degrading membrane proteinase PrsW (M82 family)